MTKTTIMQGGALLKFIKRQQTYDYTDNAHLKLAVLFKQILAYFKTALSEYPPQLKAEACISLDKRILTALPLYE